MTDQASESRIETRATLKHHVVNFLSPLVFSLSRSLLISILRFGTGFFFSKKKSVLELVNLHVVALLVCM